MKTYRKNIPDGMRDMVYGEIKTAKELGITVNAKKAEELLKTSGKNSYVDVIYGDTDSLYISYETLVKTIDGQEDMSGEIDPDAQG